MGDQNYFYYYQILFGIIYLIPLSILSDRYNSLYVRINFLDKWIKKGKGNLDKTIERLKELTIKANKIKRIAIIPFITILLIDLISTYNIPEFGYEIPLLLFCIFYLAQRAIFAFKFKTAILPRHEYYDDDMF